MSANVRRNLAVQLTAGGPNPLKLRLRGALPFKTGTAVGASLIAQGGTAPYAYSIIAGALPTAATFTASITTTVLNVSAMTNGAIYVGMPVKGAGVTAGQTVVSFGTGIGQTGSYNLGISNTLGSIVMTGTLLLAAATGIITGTPSVAGANTFTAQVQDANSTIFTASFEMPVQPILSWTANNPPNCEDALAYSYTFSISGATGTVTYVLSGVGPYYPTGISFTSGGLLSGVPSASFPGPYMGTVTATDAGTGQSIATNYLFSGTNALNLFVVTGAYGTPGIQLQASVHVGSTTGVSPFTFAVQAGSLPTGVTVAPMTSTGASSYFYMTVTSLNVVNSTFNVKVTDAFGAVSTSAVQIQITPTILQPQQATVNVGAVGPTNLNFTGGSVAVTNDGTTMTVTIPTGAGGVTSVSGTAPVVSSGGATPAISMAAATTSVPGYLLAADWTTFNGKQATVSFAAVGSTPSANGGGIAAGVITLQPADGTNPGLLTAVAQTIGGAKNFTSIAAFAGLTSSALVDVAATIRATGNTVPASGVGVEVLYNSGASTGFIFAFDRTGSVYKTIAVDGLTVTLRASGTTVLTVAAAAVTSTVNVDVSVAGQGLRVAEGSNAKQGTAILVAGTKVVANTSTTANSRIFLTSQVDGGTPGFLRVSTRTAATSFTILSSNALDTSTVAYEIFEPG